MCESWRSAWGQLSENLRRRVRNTVLCLVVMGTGNSQRIQYRNSRFTMTLPSGATAGTWKACGKPFSHLSSMPSPQMKTPTTPTAQRGPPAGVFTRERWPKEGNQAVIMRMQYIPNRCLRVEMQNNNECIHSKVWTKCPKTGFVGLMRVVAAVCAAVAEFDEGIGVTIE